MDDKIIVYHEELFKKRKSYEWKTKLKMTKEEIYLE